MIGRTLGHYRIESKLGEGGMGVVYRAFDTHLDRHVAIKVLAHEAVADEDRKRRFVQEAKSASALNHPNIVTIHDITSADGIDFIVMEYLAGRTLDAQIGRQRMRVAEALELAAQVADALGCAHAAGIVHRDLKPANIMVSDEGRVKVLDFGLAKLTECGEPADRSLTLDRAPRTEAGMIVGTVAYMSPEQAEAKKIDARSDIFSFGSVLYEMLTGQRAFQGESRISTLAAILHQEPKPFREVLPEAPREVERIVAQCLQKDPRRRFQHLEDVRILLEALKEDSQSGRLSGVISIPPAPARRIPATLLAAVLATAVIAGGLTWWLTRPSAAPMGRGPVFTQVTFDSGLTTDPALSPDGKLLAYASDRGGESNLDIWVQQVAGGQPVQVTRDAADDHDPDFSPDGSKIVFRSEREPAGIYVIATLGGEERLIAPGGRRPHFSPDGNWIAYDAGVIQQTPKIYIVAASGGPPRELQTGLPYGVLPIWSPDGKHLLFVGSRERSVFSRLDWWVAPLEGGGAMATGAAEVLQAQGFARGFPSGPRSWSGEGVLFSAALGSSTNLWRLPISIKEGRVQGIPQRLTAGSGKEQQASAAGKMVAFASINQSVRLWSLPIDSSQGRVLGPPQPLTRGGATEGRPAISADGRKVAFLSNQSGNVDVWLRDMTSGREIAVTGTPGDESHPRLTRDGARLFYGARENGKQAIYMASAGPRPGVPERVCDDCGMPMDWSPDGKRIVYWSGSPIRWWTVEVATHEKLEIMPQIDHDIHNVQYSPDGGWVAFDVPAEQTVFVAALKSGVASGRGEWIRVGEGAHPWWSPDGKLVYLLSTRDGFQCIWAQRLAVDTRQPAGENFAAQHFHGARRAPDAAVLGWGLASDRFVLPISETTGNVWLAKFE